MILFAEKLKAPEALELNLIDYLAENWEDLDIVLNERLTQLSKNGPIAIRAAKKAIEEGYSVDINTGLTIENSCYGTVLHSSDRIEGLKAFIEKRTPVYKNK
jgi:enoyl-CoA hydratase/carnithine racemase